MSIADKLTTVAENQEKVYKAGQSSMVDESKIIEKTVTGTNIVVIDDTSEIPHDVGCKVESVNLYHTDYSGGSANGITVTRNVDSSFSVSGTATAKTYFWITNTVPLEKGNVLCLSGGTDKVRLAFSLYVGEASVDTISNAGGITKLDGYPSVDGIRVTIVVESGVTVNEVVKPMVSLIETSDYTPYVDVSGMTLTVCGKNAINAGWSVGAVRYADYVHVNNEEWINAYLVSEYIAVEELSAYYLPISFTSSAPSSMRTHGVIFYDYDKKPISHVSVDATVQSISEIYTPNGCKYIRINVCNSQSISVNPGFVADFQINKVVNYTPNADGTVDGIKSLSPVMTLVSDVDGVELTVDYHKSWGKQAAYDALWESIQNGGSRTDYSYAFKNQAFTTDTFKPKYDICPTTAREMFRDNKGVIEEISEKALGVKFDTSQCTEMRNIFYSAKVKKLGTLSTLSLTTGATYELQHLFAYNTTITEIEKIILKADGTQGFDSTFIWCSNLKEIRFEGVIGQNISFSYCPLSRESLIDIIDHLSSTASGKTLTLKSSAVTDAFGSTEDSSWLDLIAMKSNWTITLA